MAQRGFEPDGITLVLKKVPARVCQNCGEEYVDDSVVSELFSAAATTARSGAEFDVRHYLKAGLAGASRNVAMLTKMPCCIAEKSSNPLTA